VVTKFTEALFNGFIGFDVNGGLDFEEVSFCRIIKHFEDFVACMGVLGGSSNSLSGFAELFFEVKGFLLLGLESFFEV